MILRRPGQGIFVGLEELLPCCTGGFWGSLMRRDSNIRLAQLHLLS
jgi:hypothetical protein